DPSPKTKVDDGSSVTIYIGEVEQVSVPTVVDETEGKANSAITKNGLVPAKTEAASDTVPAGIVISQDPIGGTTVELGSVVNIVVSTGTGTGPPPPS
ncbi:MAG TPA: PASTA domain-containing protein, partial [Acidimicrobiia bacterium]|nr:PASTA domain-containing protein [Acidimicrobiia bacterium]